MRTDSNLKLIAMIIFLSAFLTMLKPLETIAFARFLVKEIAPATHVPH
jgi:hypothetical protein